VEWGIVHRNVCGVVKRPTIIKRPATVWNPGEWRAFLQEAKGDTMAPLWYFLAVEGMRRGEALGLRWQDVNWERGTVHISQTVVPDRNNLGKALIQSRAKTNAGARSVRLTGETIVVLKEHRDRQAFQRQAAGDAWQDHDLIVCTGTGTPINPNNVTRSYNRLVMLSGVPRIRVHDMRHTAATMLLRAGVSAKIVSERLGHATIAITLDTYSHVLPDMQDVAAEAMSALLAAHDRTA
jgi:integrase